MGTISKLRRFMRRGSPDGDYVCRSCATEYSRQRQICPDCGGFSIERAEWPADEPAEVAD